MFQYATGRALALRSGVPLQVDIYDLVDRTAREDFVHRDCDLGLLMAPLDFASLAELGRAIEKPSSLMTRLALRYRKELLRKNTFREKNEQFLPSLMRDQKKHAYLMGYWHDERYFSDYKEVIAQDFAMRGNYASDYMEPIASSESVCLHVRRADFVNSAFELEVRTQCGKDYYRQAIDLIAGKHQGIRIFGFSDDVEWCAQNMKLQHPITWIPESEAGVKGGAHFWLMRQCKHFIIPNSTFAWWAAWLAENPGKTIVCPKQWYNNPDRQSDGFLPAAWHTL